MKRNEIGKTYGYIQILDTTNERKNGYVVYICKCNKCGKTFKNSLEHYKYRAKKGIQTMTCGCYNPHYNNFYKNGLSNTRLRYIYDNMKSRCYNQNNKEYKNYGKRGIIVCNQWLDKDKGFETFYNWALNNGYQDNLSIDRINVDGNYEPKNCKWSDFEEQINNRTNTVRFEYNGITKTLTKWAREYNIPIVTLRSRIARGWNIERALNEKVHKNYKGKHSKQYYKYNNMGA